jgi:hypothetical protein
MNQEVRPKEPEIPLIKGELGGGGGSLSFDRYQDNSSSSAINPPDMSVAQNANTVMVTYNRRCMVSTNGGSSFTVLDPTTIFPSASTSTSGGFCCDQVVQYVPKYDRFIWLMQFCCNGASGCLSGTGKMRIASASTQACINSNFTSWTYWDLAPANYGIGNFCSDYPDLAVGNGAVYMSFDDVGAGLMVTRMPLNEIAAGTTMHFRFTFPANGNFAYGAHIAQNCGDQIFWAGHKNSSTMQVFNWPEASNSYSWRDVGVNSWPNSTLSSTTPSKNDWLSFASGFPNKAVIGATRKDNELWFAWMASKGGGFPQSHIQMVRIGIGSWNLIGQMQVWNGSFAFGYPSLFTAPNGDIAMSLGFGGGSFEASHAVGYWGDFVVYYPRLSDGSFTRWGDYVSVRRANRGGEQMCASGYTVRKTSGGSLAVFPHYIEFKR